MCTHTQRVMPFPKSGLEGEPVPGPPQEHRNESGTKSRARSQEGQETAKEMEKVAKAVAKAAQSVINSNRYGNVSIHISLRCFHASTTFYRYLELSCSHSTFSFH